MKLDFDNWRFDTRRRGMAWRLRDDVRGYREFSQEMALSFRVGWRVFEAEICRDGTIMPWGVYFKAKTETGHDALMGIYFDGQRWNVSMYHAKHNTGIDLSVIAVKHGGGGHRGACGFRSLLLPWQL